MNYIRLKQGDQIVLKFFGDVSVSSSGETFFLVNGPMISSLPVSNFIMSEVPDAGFLPSEDGGVYAIDRESGVMAYGHDYDDASASLAETLDNIQQMVYDVVEGE